MSETGDVPEAISERTLIIFVVISQDILGAIEIVKNANEQYVSQAEILEMKSTWRVVSVSTSPALS